MSDELDKDDLGACGGSDSGNPRSISNNQNDAKLANSTAKISERTHRPRCQYGEDCYSAKPEHKEEICHPGDEGWAEDDQRRPKPNCPFGKNCFR